MRETLLGNYRVVEKLGEGGMGVVYIGRHETLGHRVVVKVLQPELSRHAEVVRRFFNEAQAATAIRNPGIVQVFDFGTTPDGRAYFVMELLEGKTLAARLAQRPPDHEECCRLGRQIANVLQAAHAAGIVHRDLKPDNLFLVPDSEVIGGQRVKVLDFGIAKLAGEVGVKTSTGLVMGTPNYMSPEQCRSSNTVDARSDIYSLGCILFEMECRRPPFADGGLGDIVAAHLHDPPPNPHYLTPDIPPGLSALILQMLAKQPDARPQTMAVVSQTLDEILRSLGGLPAHTPTSLPARSPTSTPMPSPTPPPVGTPMPFFAPSPTPPPVGGSMPFPAPSPTSLPAGAPTAFPAPSPTMAPSLTYAQMPPHTHAPAPLHTQAPPHTHGPTPPHAHGPTPPHAHGPTPPHTHGQMPAHTPGSTLPHMHGPTSSPVAPVSTTLGGVAGMSTIQPRADTRRLPIVFGGLVITGATLAIAIVVATSPQDQAEPTSTRNKSNEPPRAMTDAATVARPSLTQRPAPPPPLAVDAAVASAPPLTTAALEAQCLTYAANRKWEDLAQCADKLTSLDPKLATEFTTRATEETRSIPLIAAAEAALQDKILKRAKAELDQVWPLSADYAKIKHKYDTAEAQAIDNLAAQLNHAKDPSCQAYNQLLTKARAVNPARVSSEAANRVPCVSTVTCDADELSLKGRDHFVANQLAESLAAYEAAYACNPTPTVIRKVLVVACNLHNLAKARTYWKRLSLEMRSQPLATCLRNGITEEMLNAP